MGKLTEIKTKATEASVKDFIDSIDNERRREDSKQLVKMMKKASGKKPKMWGPNIIGFGKTVYKSPKTDREVECFEFGFSPRKANLSLYVIDSKSGEDLKKLGKFKAGKSCLWVNKLEDIDMKVLEKLINKAAKRA